MRRIVSIGLMAFLPSFCLAADPGQYVVDTGEGGSEGICLQAGGTWYGTTFDDWSGHWSEHGAHTYLEGNWAAGAGNTALVFNQYSGTWLEWTDDFSTAYYWTQARASFIGPDCDAEPGTGVKRQAPGVARNAGG